MANKSPELKIEETCVSSTPPLILKKADKRPTVFCDFRTSTHNQKATSFNPSLLLLLAACGGGGGGGSSSSRFADAPFVRNDALSSKSSRVYESTREESSLPIRAMLAEEERSLDHYVFILKNEKSGTFLQVIDDTETLYDFTLTGEDADLFKFTSEIGVQHRVENPRSLSEPNPVSKVPLDYENPTDKGGDNTYHFSIFYTTDDPQAKADGVHEQRQSLILTVTDDKSDGPTTVTPSDGPEFTREGDVIKVDVNEGTTLIYYMDDVTLPRTGLSDVLPDVLDGMDADDVQVKVTTRKSNTYDLELEFISAPDADNPSDNNRGNVYEFEFDGMLADVLPLEFEVTVVDVA